MQTETAGILTSMFISVSDQKENKKNTSYPLTVEINSTEDLQKYAEYDHVCAVYADGKNNRGRMIKGYRSNKTFRKANCMPADCNNMPSHPTLPDIPPEQWKTPADVQAAFPDVPFYVVYSRNHNKPKHDLPARPRFHVYFICDEISDRKAYERLKDETQKIFPAFDDNATDAARFLFGVDNPKVEYYPGSTPLSRFIQDRKSLPKVIPVGSRNSTLSSVAAKYLKRHGDSDEARNLFYAAADRCEEPLAEEELNTIWNSALNFFHGTIEADPNYVPAGKFTAAISEDAPPIKVTSREVKETLDILGITLRLNVISGQAEIRGMPEKLSFSNAANTLPAVLNDYFTDHNMKCSKQTLEECLVLIEDENRFNPVEEMLLSTVYDKVDRFPIIYDIMGIDHDALSCTLMRKWYQQGVALALNDDERPVGADGVLVIQKEQGTGKTLFCYKMAVSPDWFAEGVSIDLDNKDSIIQ